MKYALINTNGHVVQTSEEEFEFTQEGYDIAELTAAQAIEVDASVEPIFLVEGELVSLEAMRRIKKPEAVVPAEVTNYQFKQALNVNSADRIAVDAFVANSGDQNVIDGWAYAHSFKKNHPLFLSAVVHLGWSQQKVDELLVLAGTFD